MASLNSAPQHLPVFPAGSSAISISEISDQSIIGDIKGIVESVFAQPVQHYIEMETQAYRSLVESAQRAINAGEYARRLAADRRRALEAILEARDILVQTNLYVRAPRPSDSTAVQEFVGWHRESFYGPDMAASVNFWVPIDGVTADSTLQYVPDSHLIPDDDIAVVEERDASVERYSVGHRIGLLYAPKRIVGGVDFGRRRPMEVPQGSAAIFAGALIHGAGENHSDRLRFSVDFRLIAADNLRTAKSHFASGKDYFEPL